MKYLCIAVFLFLSGFVSAEDDGSWKGEGLAESQDWGQYNYGYYPYASPYYANFYSPYYSGYWGHYGAAPLAADGRVVDTPEVAAAKMSHFAAHSAASNGVVSSVVPADTPEVALAKSAHFAAYNMAAAKSAGYHAYPYAAYPYYGYYGSPVELTHDGKYLKDTPEVAAAKARHFAALAAASK